MRNCWTSNAIHLWNVHEKVPHYTGAQTIVNVLGHLANPAAVESLDYSLNEAPTRSAVFKAAATRAPRLVCLGDFNIDTITKDALKPVNTLLLRATYARGIERFHRVEFRTSDTYADRYSLRKRLKEADYPEQVGQVVDGCWIVSTDNRGQKCLEMTVDRAGYDRIILLTAGSLGQAYTIRARLCVTRWLRNRHHVGLVFKWNPHLQGDGTYLPDQWSTGIAHYYSNCAGLRFRIGVDVHFDEHGKKVGGHNLGEAVLCPRRAYWNRLLRRISFLPQLPAGKEHWFELTVRGRRYSLAIWRAGRPKPRPQLVVEEAPDLLRGNVAGIIAYYCGVRIYEFEIEEDSV